MTEKEVGFRYELRDDVHIFYIRSVDRRTVDALYELGTTQNRQAAETSGHLMRVWIAEKLVFPTPYLKDKLMESIRNTPHHLYISTALVLSDPMTFWAVSTFLRRTMTVRQRTEVQVCRTLEEALEWLDKRRAMLSDNVG